MENTYVPNPLPHANPHPDAVPFLHIKEHTAGMNPVLNDGIEYIQLDNSMTLSHLQPWFFATVAEVAKDAVFAIRDFQIKISYAPGENVYSKATSKNESYYAKVKGRLVLIDHVFHILPSNIDAKLSVHISEDNLKADISVSPGYGEGRKLDFAYVMDELRSAEVVSGIDELCVQAAIHNCNAKLQPIKHVAIAKGHAPVEWVSGEVEYFFSQTPPISFEETEKRDGHIDFRSLNLIPVVEKGQLLARIHPDTPGSDGKDVKGLILPAAPLPPKPLLQGKNVRTEKEGSEFFSEIDGCVNLNGVRLEVLETFVVNSDVDYRTGNIRFAGSILVNGTVHQGFEVYADGDVIIQKNAEASRITAGRDIIIKGGILGDGKGQYSAIAGRNVHLGFAENAWVEAQGDVIIGDYSMQSLIHSCGHVRLGSKKGAILGGECVAGKGIQAKVIGSYAGIKTLLVAGTDFLVARKLVVMLKQISDLDESVRKIEQFLKVNLELARKQPLSPAKAESVKTMIEKRSQILNATERIQEQVREIKSKQGRLESVEIRVTGITYPEVTLNIQGNLLKITEEVARALFVFDNEVMGIITRSA